jgi:starch-binding outer membrane protein, SusD/RagB family
MKTKIYKKCALVAALFFLMGCDDFLKEEVRDQITTSNFFNNDSEAILAVNGLYRILHRPSLYNIRGLDFYTQYGSDENGPSRDIGGDAATYNYLIAEGNADGKDTWASLYEIVRNTSTFIPSIDGNLKLSEAVRNQVLGELLFMRALAYFHLTNLWGDVPYFKTPLSLKELSVIERTPKATIRTEIKADLARAFTLLPTSYSGSNLGRASKWAAAALKAKYHLFDKEWALTVTECANIINNSPHRLLANFADVFNQKDPFNQFNLEQIFVVDFTADQTVPDAPTWRTDDYNPRLRDEPANAGDRNNLGAALTSRGEGFTGFGYAIPLPQIANQSNWQVGDLRYDVSITQNYLGFPLRFPYFKKNWGLDQVKSPRQNHPENYVVFRLADVYLMAAEAENEANGPANAYQYVNKVRERAFEPDQPWSGLSQSEFRLKMYDERKFELCAEGYRKMDLVRWGILVDVIKATQHRPWSSPAANIMPKHVLLPIPLSEILLNPNLLKSDPTNNGYR